MTETVTIPQDVPFSAAVKAIQARKGSRQSYAELERDRGWRTEVDDNLAAFLAAQTSMFLATASADGQPYVQHRGGPPGFIRVLDKTTLGFADFSGNQQFITQGNLSENPRAMIFLIDYAYRQRIKIWGEARIIEDDPALLRALMPAGYRARPEQALLFRIAVWDINCKQHIPQKLDAADVKTALELRDARIAELEAQLAALKGSAASSAARDAASARSTPSATSGE